MRRKLLGVALLAVLVLSAGCTDVLGPRQISDEQLDEAASYDWDTEANATINVTTNEEYEAVYRVTDEEFEVYQNDGLGNERPVRIRALYYRYPNGTVVNGTDIDVETTRTATVIDLPQANGQVAYTADTQAKRFESPPLVDGSYVVVLPENRRVDNFLFGQVRPGGYDTERIDGRLHVRWADGPDDPVSVHFYMQRDVYIFVGVLAVLGVGLVGGVAYVYRQIQALREEREELGLNLDVDDDDFGDDPPPGMG